MVEKVILNWSSGKDSAIALYELIKNKDYKVEGLLTTITKDFNRVSMHGVHSILLDKQVKSLDLTIDKIYIDKNGSNLDYELKMSNILKKYRNNGISTVVYGDIFLKDVRQYRENNLSKIGMNGLFPLWERDTTELAYSFISLGFDAIVTCIDSKVLDKRFVGREFNECFLSELPNNVDPCGENGEFHTFVYNGPIFKRKISYKKGKIILRDKRFYYCDLIDI